MKVSTPLSSRRSSKSRGSAVRASLSCLYSCWPLSPAEEDEEEAEREAMGRFVLPVPLLLLSVSPPALPCSRALKLLVGACRTVFSVSRKSAGGRPQR